VREHREANDYPWGRTLHYDGQLDEIVVNQPSSVHLEQMDTHLWCLLINRGDDDRIAIWIGAKRAAVHATIYEPMEIADV
jgi:hypothetical protein